MGGGGRGRSWPPRAPQASPWRGPAKSGGQRSPVGKPHDGQSTDSGFEPSRMGDGMARRGRKVPEPRLIDDRNRVSLPRDVLQALDVDPGDFVTFIVDEHG